MNNNNKKKTDGDEKQSGWRVAKREEVDRDGGGEWGRLNQQQGIIVSIEILKLMLL